MANPPLTPLVNRGSVGIGTEIPEDVEPEFALPDTFPVYVAPTIPPYAEDAPGLLEIGGERSTLHLHWRSNWTQEPGGGPNVLYGESRGLDTNDGQHPYRPLATYKGIMRKYPPGFRMNAKCIIHMADGSSPNNGFDGGTNSAPLFYQADELWVGGYAANFNSYCWWGPPRFRKVQNLGTLTNQFRDGVYPGASTRLVFGAGPMTSDTDMLFYLLAYEANGNMILPPMQTGKCTTTDMSIPDSGSMYLAFPYDGTYYLGRPGVVLESANDLDTQIRGYGCYCPGRLEKHQLDPQARNPFPVLANMEVAGLIVGADGVSLDGVNLLDHPLMVNARHFSMKGVRAQGGVYFHGGDTAPIAWLNNTTGNITNRIKRFQMPGWNGSSWTDAAGQSYNSPDVFCDLHMARKSSISLSPGLYLGAGLTNNASSPEAGSDKGHHSGHLSVTRCISGYDLSTRLIYASDHSTFSMIDFAGILADEVPGLVLGTDKAEIRLYGDGVRHAGTFVANSQLALGGRATGGTVGDPQESISVATWIAEGRNYCINRPRVPANWLGLGNAATPAYGCHARIKE